MKSKAIKFNKPAPLSQNQLDYLKRSMNSWLNIAEGGKRGGKNVLQTLAFCIALETHKDRLHLVSGVSVATALLNVIDCDGYGVTNFYSGRCKYGKFNERNCLYVNTKTGEKIILISGGGKLGDEKAIKGQTFGMAYITEVNECHQVFVKEVFDRTLSSSDRKVFHDLNPKSPDNWYYTDVLDVHKRNNEIYENYGFNYGHFTIADNYSISDEKLNNILRTYDKNSIWYKRDILGERIATEGLIYQQFAENNSVYLVDKLELENPIISLGIDYGASKSRTSFKCVAFYPNYSKVIVIDEMEITDIKSPEMLYSYFHKFYNQVVRKYNHVNYAFCDYGALGKVLTTGLQNYCYKNGIGLRLGDCEKGKIIERIQLVNYLIANNKFFVLKTCENMINALNNALWDDKHEDKRLDNGTSDIDSMDALEYAIFPFRSKLMNYY